jgi:hypothetical protein
LSLNWPHAVHGKSGCAGDAAAVKVAGLISGFSIKCEPNREKRVASLGELRVIYCGGRASCSR